MHSTFGFKLISQKYQLIIFIAVIILLSLQVFSLAHKFFHVAKSTILHEDLIIGVPQTPTHTGPT